MQSRRCNIEIIADILRIGGTGGKTNIMYGCDLSYHQLQRYLRFLLARGLMELHSGDEMRKTYKPTAEGEQLLGIIDSVRALLGLEDHDATINDRDTRQATLRRGL